MTLAALIIGAVFAAYSLVRAELDKYELKRRIEKLQHENLELALSRRVPRIEPISREDLPEGIQPDTLTTQAIRRTGRPGRFMSFGAEKRRLESQEVPQRSVKQ